MRASRRIQNDNSSRSVVPRILRIVTYAILSLWSLVCLFPIYWLAVTSIKGAADVDQAGNFLPFLNFEPSLDAWRFILTTPSENLVSRFINSLIIGSVSTVLTLIIACLAIYAVTRSSNIATRADGQKFLIFILCTRLLPPTVLALPVFMMLNTVGLLDTRTALVFVYSAINLPVAIWLLQPAFGNKATEIEEAAHLDGASQFAILFTILLPTLRSALVATGLLLFILCWNEYVFAVYLTSDNALTLPPWLVGQLSMKEAQTGGGPEEVAQLSAAATFMIIPLIVFATIALRPIGKAAVWQANR